MRFGYHNASFHRESDEAPFDALVSFVQRLEAAGFDWISTMDHLWQLPFVGDPHEPFYDAYTTLPALAQATESVEVSALVTSPHYRNPALLGRMLTTLDHVSGGRAVLGIGAGWFEAEYRGYGFEFPDAAKRIAQMEETIELIRTMWTADQPVSFEGEFYEIDDLVLSPKPVQDPHPPILIGGGGEQLTLRVVARQADRWNLPAPSPGEFEHKLGVLQSHCAEVGRPVDEIEKTVMQSGVIRDSTEAAHEAFEDLKTETDAGVTTDRDEYRGIVGTPDEVVDLLERFEDLGVEMVMLRAIRNDPQTVDHLIDDVVPRLS